MLIIAIFFRCMQNEKMPESKSIFMRECLSKAIQWKSPDLLVKNGNTESIVTSLEELLDLDLEKLHCGYTGIEYFNKLEVILVEISNKDFDIMEACLNVLKTYVPGEIRDLWKLYKQYLGTDFDKIVCLCCKIRSRVDIKHCSIYLYRSGIVSGHLHTKIICRNASTGRQEDLWNELEDACDKYHTPKQVVEAIYCGLQAYADQYGALLDDYTCLLNQENPTFKCQCQETFSRLFIPNIYKVETRNNVINVGFLEKENTIPKLEQIDSVNSRKHSVQRRTRGSGINERRQAKVNTSAKEPQNQETVVAQDAIEYFGTEYSENEIDNDETALQQPISQKLNRSKDRSTKCKIFNFYNRGNVNFGTSVVQMRPNTKNDAQADDTATDSDSSPDERFALASPESSEEKFTKRLKYTREPLAAITYPTHTEASDEAQRVSSTSNIDERNGRKNIKQYDFERKRIRFKSETVQHTVPVLIESGHYQNNNELYNRPGRLLRQCSAPNGL